MRTYLYYKVAAFVVGGLAAVLPRHQQVPNRASGDIALLRLLSDNIV